MKFFLTLGLICFSFISYTEEKSNAQKIEENPAKVELDSVLKKSWALYGSYSLYDLWIPGKIGLNLSYGTDFRRYELIYQSASYSFDLLIDDLGRISDTRIYFATRSHTWENSFNFQYGLFYNNIAASLGNVYTDTLGSSFDVLEVKTAGIMWGVGNRWHFDNGFGFGLDWFKVFWPLYADNEANFSNVADSPQKEDAKSLVDALSSIPTLSILNIEFGYRF